MMIYTPYIWLPLFSTVVLAGVALYAQRFRNVPACLPFRVFVWLVTLFGLIFSLSLVAGTLALRVTLLRMIYIPGAFIAPTILVLVIEYTGYTTWLTRLRLAALLSIPIITIALALIPPLQSLFCHSPQFTMAGPLTIVTFSRGPWYWVYYIYASALTIASLTILLVSLRNPTLHISDTMLLTLGIFIPTLADVFTVLRITPLPGYLWTPLLMACTSVLYTWVLLRGQIFVVARIARSLVVDHIDDLMIVIDLQGRIADFNHAAQVACRLSPQMIGARLEVLSAEWSDLCKCYQQFPAGQVEVEVGAGEQRQIYDLAITTIFRSSDRPLGCLLILHNVTQRKRADDELRKANQNLQLQLAQIQQLQAELREQATHDVLTGLFNRRYMQEILKQCLADAERYDSLVSIMMLDIDHFKQLNDEYGHKAGDLMLQAIGTLIGSSIRQMDTACRYGGEEFVVIMPRANLDVAMCRADELRTAFENMCITYQNHQLRATISIGVASFPTHGTDDDTLLRAADQALYMAKAIGRNRACTADPHLAMVPKLLTTP
jgi:diguanylate cyclase (GGDEF)-like protein